MSARMYIFLDVDGVLHPATWQVPGLTPEQMQAMTHEEIAFAAALGGMRAVPEGELFSRLPLLEQTLRPNLTDLEIVITSSWRHDTDAYGALLAAFSSDVRARVAGPTPHFGKRPWEIKAWLDQQHNPEALPIVIDDDLTHAWDRIERPAVFLFTQTEVGFSDEDAYALKALLQLDPSGVAALKTKLPELRAWRSWLEWIEKRVAKC